MTQESTAESAGVEFFIHKVFIEDASFEAPKTPLIFQKKWAPAAEIEVDTSAAQLDKTNYQVSLTLTITAKNDQETAFLVQLKQTGIFGIQEADQSKLAYLINAYCPAVLFPYARENISGMVSRGGFPELNIAPINFDALYAQSLEKTKAEA